LLGLYNATSDSGPFLIGVGFVIFVLAGITDVLDGYLARRLAQQSAFGRIVDPFVDKILVVGAFVMLAAPNFIISADSVLSDVERSLPHWLTGGMISAVQPWMVVVVLAREFVISAIRGYSESQGIKFPATSAGKLKMLLQSLAIGTVLFCVAWTPELIWAMWVKIILVWLSVIATVVSAFFYVSRTGTLLRENE
ncbi:MAG TPA: hypothetical protein ENH84_03285, partial [Phycisphaerae bacterium]|nr:hypothetical protein [Phycisphaerae bacterium]